MKTDFLIIGGGIAGISAAARLSHLGSVTLLEAEEALAHNKLKASDLDWFIPHQANLRIIDGIADKIGLPHERVIRTVAKHGNTSAASVPLALDSAVRDARIQDGHLVLLQGVGGGMTWGSVLLRF